MGQYVLDRTALFVYIEKRSERIYGISKKFYLGSGERRLPD